MPNAVIITKEEAIRLVGQKLMLETKEPKKKAA